MTPFSRVAFSFSIFATKWSATNGPFLRERLTLLAPPPHDHFVGSLVATRLFAHRHLTPRRRRRTAGRRARLTTAMRMVDRVHRDAANVRTLSAMTLPSGISNDLVFVFEIAELTDRGAAQDRDLAHFTRRHAHLSVLAFLC